MSDNKEQYIFGAYGLDPASRELKHSNSTVEIEPKAFDLLIYLIENRERAVNKDELLENVWPGMVLTDTALTRAVMKARKAVGDDASAQSVIKTVHGHGYRFVADVQISTPAKPAPEPDAKRASKSASVRNIAIALSVVVLISIAWWTTRTPQAEAGDLRLAVMPVSDLSNDPEFAWVRLGLMSYVSSALSDDGSIQVVADGNVIGLADRLEWTGKLNDSANSELIEKMGRVYGASHILSMDLKPEGNAWRMTYGLQGPNGEMQQGTMVGDEGTVLADGVVQAVYGLLLRRSRLQRDIQLVSQDPFNNEAFARGMALSLEGRCPDAVQYFRVITDQEPTLFEPRYQLAYCLRIMGDSEAAEEVLLQLVNEQRALGSSRELARSEMLLGIVYNRTGRMEEARTFYDSALALSQNQKDPDMEGRVLQNLSILHKDINQLDEADELLNLAVLAYQRAGREVMPGQLWSGKANINMARGDLNSAEVDLQRALEAFRDIGDLRNEAMMLNNTGYLRRRQGRIDEAESYHLRSLEIRIEIDDRVGQGRIWSMLAGVYTAQGRYDEAEKAAQSALEIARESKDRLFEGTSLTTLADAEKAQGRNEEAREHYLQSREVFTSIEDFRRALQVDLRLVQLQLEAGEFDRARQKTEEVLQQARQQELMNTEVQAMEKLGDIDYSQGDIHSAIGFWGDGLEILSKTSWGSKIKTLSAKLANAHMDSDELDLAAPLVGRLAGEEPSVQSLKVQARFAFLSGDADRAVHLMQQAKELAGEHWADNSEAALQEYQAAVQGVQ